jgi:hypothetical protein
MGSFQNVRYESVHNSTPREVVNQGVCNLCEQLYLKSLGDIGICGRKLCRDAYAKSDKLQRENLRSRWPKRPYQVNW